MLHDEDYAAINEDDGSEEGRDKLRAGEERRGVTEPVLNVS